jgi:phosphoribosyl 1,2-cyclic phosphate phosphodiesterase
VSQPVGRVTLLGTGTSHGVPMIGCTCATCRSVDPHDKRMRPSVYVELASGTCILIDTAPDLRTQALTFGVVRADAILFTHCHADHVMGLDEVRRFNVLQGQAVPCFGDSRSLAELRRSFAYIFEEVDRGGGIPRIELHAVDGPFRVGAQTITPVPVLHGEREIMGYRIGNFAYVTDASAIPDGSWALLEGLDVLVINALRHRPHPTHFSVAEALAVVERLRPKQAYLTHVCHDLPHVATNASLPAGVELAWDGLRFEI